MLDLNFVREHRDAVTDGLNKRGSELSLAPFESLDARRRELLQEVETLKATRNKSSKEIGAIMKSGGDATALREEMRQVGEKITALGEELETTENELRTFMYEIPNAPHAIEDP